MRISDWSSDLCSSDLSRSTPRSSESRASISPFDMPGLRLGLSRHCSVVTARPVPSTSIAPPSKIQSDDLSGVWVSRAMEAATVSSLGRSYLPPQPLRSEEHTSELQSLMRISYAVFCLKKKRIQISSTTSTQ